MGAPTGIQLAPLLEASARLATALGKELPALVGRAEPVYNAVLSLRRTV
jgi:hypothetical protein